MVRKQLALEIFNEGFIRHPESILWVQWDISITVFIKIVNGILQIDSMEISEIPEYRKYRRNT